MEFRPLALVFPVLCLSVLGTAHATTAGNSDGTERWGYVEVRPKAHLFWWYYKSPHRVSTPTKPWPTVLWLQGVPGASGVGLGNFLEVGPLDGNLKPRNSTWLHKADLIFVDNPVGVGYSYVEDDSLLVTTDLEAAADMITLLKALVKEVKTLESSPLFLVGESYGGKYAATLGVSVVRAVHAGDLKLTLGGVALGDSWISPEDFASSYGTLLLEVSRLDSNGADHANKDARVVRQQIAAGQFRKAQITLSKMLNWIVVNSGHVDVYNFLLDAGMDPVAAASARSPSPPEYSRYLESKSIGDTIQGAMNGAIKQKLNIIPKDIVWQAQSYAVYYALINDFMKPRIEEVDKLLSYGVNVTVYNGQLDVICSTIGAEMWVQKLKWDGLKNFLSLPRQPLYCGSVEATKGFVRSYMNLHFYWILGAGHFVPVDQPCIALDMIAKITQSPALALS
ncbi:serine carboxypeptidase-like 51 [Lolium rigidum]|uniref:serine carboxypeptidase-like 51 n=1 Tax=Lolium rigidum TaxID=89674 RepID=UPI001F5D1D51|nr:serine carboxypeptidase-like 51 [Lolium rigidum]